MPAGDVIFQRMDVARDAELSAIARALRQDKAYEKQRSKAEKLDLLSRELRKDAGSAFRNWLRNDHDLAYVSILEDVAAKAADAADWSNPKVSSDTNIKFAENYIVRALAFAASKKKATSKEVDLINMITSDEKMRERSCSSGAAAPCRDGFLERWGSAA